MAKIGRNGTVPVALSNSFQNGSASLKHLPFEGYDRLEWNGPNDTV